METLAEAWWEKMQRVRSSVGAGTPDTEEPDTEEIDRRIDDLLKRFVAGMRARHRKWRYRLESAFGCWVPGPAALRRSVEARLPSLAGKPEKSDRECVGSGGKTAQFDPLHLFDETLAVFAELMTVLLHGLRGHRKAKDGGNRTQ